MRRDRNSTTYLLSQCSSLFHIAPPFTVHLVSLPIAYAYSALVGRAGIASCGRRRAVLVRKAAALWRAGQLSGEKFNFGFVSLLD